MTKSVRECAMDLLARREHSCHELRLKLSKKGFDQETIEAALERLQFENLLNETRFAESYVRYRSGSGFGPLRIIQELKSKGLDDAVIEQAIWKQSIDWREQLSHLFQKKYHQAEPFGSKAYAAQLRFLSQRGFMQDDIHQLLQNITVEQ